MELPAYYDQPAVRARIAEYCGAASGELEEATCRYLLTSHGPGEPPAAPTMRRWSPAALGTRENWDFDVFRSLQGREGMLTVLDVEYINSDYRGEAFAFPERAFAKLEATYAGVEAVCAEVGLPHLTIVTGQGYHFAWQLPTCAEAASEMAALGRPPATLFARYRAGNTLTGEIITEREGRLYAGLGLLVEWLMHLALRRAGASSPIPVVCSALEVGSRGEVGREAASLDLSAYADPLDRRYVRCAFSTYQKHRTLASSVGQGIARDTPPRVCVRRAPDDTLEAMLAAQSDFAEAAARAAVSSAVAPDGTAGLLGLLSSYRPSRLAHFHDWFYAAEADAPARWPEGYDRLDLSALPPCVARPLARPNDLLLKPTNVLNITRVLWAQGWHPRHIAGLIRSKYERDHGWGTTWLDHDAAARAEVTVRIFAGLAADGTDDLRDFNCISHQEKGYCPQPFCGHNLRDFRGALSEMRE